MILVIHKNISGFIETLLLTPLQNFGPRYSALDMLSQCGNMYYTIKKLQTNTLSLFSYYL